MVTTRFSLLDKLSSSGQTCSILLAKWSHLCLPGNFTDWHKYRDWKTNVVLQGCSLFPWKHPLLQRTHNLDLKVSPRKLWKFFSLINLPAYFSNYLGYLHENILWFSYYSPNNHNFSKQLHSTIMTSTPVLYFSWSPCLRLIL